MFNSTLKKTFNYLATIAPIPLFLILFYVYWSTFILPENKLLYPHLGMKDSNWNIAYIISITLFIVRTVLFFKNSRNTSIGATYTNTALGFNFMWVIIVLLLMGNVMVVMDVVLGLRRSIILHCLLILFITLSLCKLLIYPLRDKNTNANSL